MNAAGISPWILFRPFLAVGLVVSVVVGALNAYIAPLGLRELRHWAAQVRADLVSNIVQPGRFITIDNRLTLHIRERRPNGQLLGILIDDQRNAKERLTIVAERGDLVKNGRGLFLVLENGNVQRHEAGDRDLAVVLFDSYGFDLSSLESGAQEIKYSARERYLWELYDTNGTEGRFTDRPREVRAEFHDRLTSPLYPLAFVVVIYAYLGAPRTTRQSRALSLCGAIGASSVLRMVGFFGIIGGVHSPITLLLPYLALASAFALGCLAISRGVAIEPPAVVARAFAAVGELVTRRSRRLVGQPS